MLQRFSTGLISGEFGGQHVFSIKFGTGLFLHHAWVALAACAGAPSWTKVSLLLRRFVFRMAEASAKRVTGDEPQGTMGRVQRAGEIFIKRETSGYEAGRTSCGDWNWTIFARLLLHSHFYGEGRASLLSLICCWCSNRQSKSVLGVKSISQWDRSLSFLPNDPFWTFFTLICWRNLAILRTQTISFFGLGSWKKYLGQSSEKRKSSHSSAVRFLHSLANFSQAARCLAVSRGFFCLLSGLPPLHYINLQMVFFPPTWPLLANFCESCLVEFSLLYLA